MLSQVWVHLFLHNILVYFIEFFERNVVVSEHIEQHNSK